MLTSTVIDNTNIVTATYDGSLGTEEMERLREQLTRVVATYGKARLLVEYGDIDLGRIEPAAIWEDVKTAGLIGDIDRYALVTDQQWIGKVSEIADRFLSAEVKVFGAGERDAAMVWLSQPTT